MSSQSSSTHATPKPASRKESSARTDSPAPRELFETSQTRYAPARASAGSRPDANALQRTFGNQAIGRALRSGKGEGVPNPATTPVRHAAIVDSIVARGSAFQLSRKPEFTTPAISVTPDARGSVQRFVMSNAEWKSKSSRIGKQRSTLLLDIDEALDKYNNGQKESLPARIALLRDLRNKIFVWEASKKRDKNGKNKSARYDTAMKLKNAVIDELTELTGQEIKANSSASPQHIIDSGSELYKRATRDVREALSYSPKQRKALKGASSIGHWPELIMEALRLQQRASALGGGQVPATTAAAAEQANAVEHATGVFAAIQALALVVNRFVTGNKDGANSSANIMLHYNQMLTSQIAIDYTGANAAAVVKLLVDMKQNLKDFAGLAGIDLKSAKDDSGGVGALEDEEPDGYEPIKEVLSFVDQAGTLATYYGGTDNSGFKESHHAPPETGKEDTRTGSQKAVGDFFGKMDPGDKAGQDFMWGGGDLVGGIVGMFSGGKEIYDAIKTLRDPKADPDKKRQAKEALAQSGVATVGSFVRYLAGAMTIHRGTGYSPDAKTGEMVSNTTAKSNFGFKGEGADMTTDMRMASDFAGILANVISFITQMIEIYKWMTGEAKEEWEGGGARQKIEVIGTGLSKMAGLINTGAGAGFTTAKMVMQIQGSGVVEGTGTQMTQVGLAGGAGAGAMPILGLIVSTMSLIQNGYKMARLGIRKHDIKKKLKELYANRKNVDLDTAEAIELVDLTLYKRMVRVGIELGHNVAQIAGGAATVSGMGSAVGMSISLASTLGKIGQVGVRVGKQKARNRKAKKRQKKDEGRGRAFESYSDWKRRKQRAAGDDRWKRFWAGVDIKFTPNWDKSSDAKGMERREAALKIVELNDMTVYHGLGIHKHHLNGKEVVEKLQLVVEALNKRD